MRPYNLESLLESNLQTRSFVKSLGMEELQQMLGIYVGVGLAFYCVS